MKKGRKTLIAGVLLFLIGTLIVPALILLTLLGSPKPHQFFIPGTTEVKVEKKGRYYLWNDFQTVYEGTSYDRSEAIPDGLEITVIDENSQVLPFQSSTSITSSNGGSTKKSIGYVELEASQVLTISVTGDVEDRVFSFSKSIFGAIFKVVGASALTCFTGLGLSLWGMLKLSKADRDEPPLDAIKPEWRP